MLEHKTRQDFEGQLLDHVELLYSVAVQLTKNLGEAQHVTRAAVLQAWRKRGEFDDGRNLKVELLTLLRQVFINHRRVSKLREASFTMQERRSLAREGAQALLPCRPCGPTRAEAAAVS